MPDCGTYIVKIKVKKSIEIVIGSLGKMRFEPGIYVYVGSAMNSISGRIKRHVKKSKKLHWHIDYLTSASEVDVIGAYAFYDKKIEEKVSFEFSKRYRAVGKFGASDMRRVNSNLYIADEDVDKFIELLGGVSI